MNKGFASDNNAGVHPQIMEAIVASNVGHCVGYGDDPWCERAVQLFKKEFGQQTEVFFAFNGTGANILSIQSHIQSFHAIICAETAHINVDECGAPEKLTGAKIIPVSTIDGKLTPELVKPLLHGFGFCHHSQPGMISITQVTELGTIYTIEEIKALAELAHEHNMYLHLDGARIANAAVALNAEFRDFTVDAGVDIVSFGGTKNGLMMGEAVLIFDPKLAKTMPYLRKQNAQLFSKMRFVGAQFEAYFTDKLWKKTAHHANAMAKLLAESVAIIPEVKITQDVVANGVFAKVPSEIIEELQKEFFFYVWDPNNSEVRWMTSFDTTPEDIERFVTILKKEIDKLKVTA